MAHYPNYIAPTVAAPRSARQVPGRSIANGGSGVSKRPFYVASHGFMTSKKPPPLSGSATLVNAGVAETTSSAALSSALDPGVGHAGIFSGNANTSEPDAYLQYIFFDQDHNFQQAGFEKVTPAAHDQWAKLSFAQGFVAPMDGYLYVYVANETLDDQEVLFDDLKITHESSTANFKVSQVNDYYPFGMLTSNTWRDAGYVDPGYLYQSSYASYDSLTGYYDFLSRSYDPALGRFFAMDPAGQFSTPYGAMGNVPHMMVDPNGELAFMAIMGVLAKAAKIYGMASTAVNVSKGFSEGGWKGGLQAIGSAAIGYGAGALGGSIIGGLDIKGALPGAVAGAAIQGTISGGITHLAGGDFWNGFKGGAISGGIQGGIQGGVSAYDEGRNPFTGQYTRKSITRFGKSYDETLSSADLDDLMANRKGLDLKEYFEHTPDIDAEPIMWQEVVDDDGMGYWNHYRQKLIEHDLWKKSGAITPVYPEAFVIGGGMGAISRLGLSARAALTGRLALNFAKAPARHMLNPARQVSMKTVFRTIKKPGYADPGGSSAMMHYSRIMHKGKLYNFEVLFEKTSKTIYHFKYTRKAIGPLSKIPK